MRLLRADLLVSTESRDSYLVRDPISGKTYRFSEGEHFLLDALRKPYRERVLVAGYNAKFKGDFTLSDLHAMLVKLDAWGLLERPRESAPVPPAKAETQHQRARYKNHWSLFCPETLLDWIVHWFGSFRYLAPAIPLVLGLSVAGWIINSVAVRADLQDQSFNLNLFQHIMFTLFTTSLASQLLRGVVARHFGLATPSFGLALIFGFMPRFNMRIETPRQASKSVKLWLAAASPIARVLLFCIGFLIWFTTRSQGTVLPFLGLFLALFSIVSFLFVANPLMGGAGYRLLSEWFDCPNLRDKAFRALRYRFFKPPPVVAKYTEDTMALRLYAVASVAFVLTLVSFISITLASWLEINYGGLGVVVTLMVIAYVALQSRQRVFRLLIPRTPRGALQRGRGDSPAESSPAAESRDTPPPRSMVRSGRLRRLPWRRLLVLLAVIACMFLPYHYESGGPARVLPAKKNGIYMQYPGVIEHVLYDGGEWLEQGTVIARMANHRQRRDIDITRAQVKKNQEELEVLLTTPSAAQIALASAELETAKVQLNYQQKHEERIDKLHARGDVSYVTFEDAVRKLDLARHDVVEKEANLQLIESLVNAHEIESVKAEIKILQRDLVYYQELLDRTELRMPFDGRITTMHLRDLENSYLEEGDVFAEVEDSSRVSIEIDIPESDIGVVAVGDRVRLKLQILPGSTMTGEVSAVYPTSEETPYGAVIKVVSDIDNPDYLLKSDMTGYAKVEGKEMILIEAYSRALMRFVQIELWSWLP